MTNDLFDLLVWPDGYQPTGSAPKKIAKKKRVETDFLTQEKVYAKPEIVKIKIGLYGACATSIEEMWAEFRQDAVSLIHEAVTIYYKRLDARSDWDWEHLSAPPWIVEKFEDDIHGVLYLLYVVHYYEAEPHEVNRFALRCRLDQQNMEFVRLFSGDFYRMDRVENSRFEEKVI